VVQRLDAQAGGGEVVATGSAEDATSALSRLEISIDDDEWRTVSPEGGFADQRALRFRARVPGVEPGEHTVAIRAVDAAGNYGTRATRVTVPKAR
jgi:hypothetical protein